MFPATPFIFYNMLPMSQPVFLARPVLQPAQGFYGVPPMVYGAFPMVQFLPQGNFCQIRRKNDDLSGSCACWESLIPQESCTTSSSPCSSQESSGYSSENETGSPPGLVQYRFQEAPPAGKRLPVFEAIHEKGLKQLQARRWVSQDGQQVPCPEGRYKMPEGKKLPRRFKSVLCKHFMVGKCRNGDECRYAHGVEELRDSPLPKNFKTRPCVNFMLRNSCPFGKKCDYIH